MRYTYDEQSLGMLIKTKPMNSYSSHSGTSTDGAAVVVVSGTNKIGINGVFPWHELIKRSQRPVCGS